MKHGPHQVGRSGSRVLVRKIDPLVPLTRKLLRLEGTETTRAWIIQAR